MHVSNTTHTSSCDISALPCRQPPDCKAVIERLRNCGEAELLAELNKFETWNLGKCELFHWIEPLDALDAVLEQAAARVRGDGWLLACDMPDYAPVSQPIAVPSSADVIGYAPVDEPLWPCFDARPGTHE